MRQAEPAQKPQPIPGAERVVAALGLVLCVIFLVSLLQQVFLGEPSPPDIEIAVLSVRQQRNGYLVEIQVSNRGQMTAAHLVVEGTIWGDSDKEERSEVTLDYVAGGSDSRAGLFFTSDPRNADLKIRPSGYHKP